MDSFAVHLHTCVPFPTRADTPVRPYNTSTHPGNIPHVNVGADQCPKIRNRSFVAPKPRYGCPQADISAPTTGHMDVHAGTIHQCGASAPCCFSGICRTGSYVRHRKRADTPLGRTVKPFHNDNRCVARSDTCGIHHKSRRPRRRSNRYQPRFRYPFDLFKVVPFFRRIPAGGAFCTTQRLMVVGQLRRPSASVRPVPRIGRTHRSAPTTHRETCRACLSSYTLLYI